MLSTTKFVYRKFLGICDALRCVSHKLQSVFKSGQGITIAQINFSTAIDSQVESTKREFASSSALGALEVLPCLF